MVICMARDGNYWGMWIGVTDEPYLYVDVARRSKQVAIGYIYSSETEDADLSFLMEDLEEDELRERFDSLCTKIGERAYIGERPGTIFGYFVHFVREMEVGDVILVPSTRRSILVCEIVGNYFHVRSPDDECSFEHRRKMRVIGELEDKNLAPDLAKQVRGRRFAIWRIKRD